MKACLVSLRERSGRRRRRPRGGIIARCRWFHCGGAPPRSLMLALTPSEGIAPPVCRDCARATPGGVEGGQKATRRGAIATRTSSLSGSRTRIGGGECTELLQDPQVVPVGADDLGDLAASN